MYEMPQIRVNFEDPCHRVLFCEVKRLLGDLARELEHDICTHVLSENTKEAERISRYLVETQKILSALKPY
jgi:hypothetical protein